MSTTTKETSAPNGPSTPAISGRMSNNDPTLQQNKAINEVANNAQSQKNANSISSNRMFFQFYLPVYTLFKKKTI